MSIVSVWQLDCSESEPPVERKKRVLQELPNLLSTADIVVLPELWLSGAFNLKAVADTALLVDAEFRQQLQNLVDESGATLHAGTFPVISESHASRYTNTALILRPQQAVSIYRKQYLFGFEDGEKRIMDSSEDLLVIDTAVGMTGVTTCYDLRFPEMFRELLDAGAETFVVAAGWPAARINHWEVLLQARAIENQSFVIGANQVGSHAGVELGGRSMVISPTGVVLGQAGSNEEVLSVEIDLAESAKWRNDFPVLQDRRIK